MHRFVFVLLLALLLEPTAAASPIMNATLPVHSLGSFCSDADGIVCGVCELCTSYCVHAMNNPPRRAPTFTAETFLEHPEWPGPSLAVLEVSPEPELYEPELQQPPANYTERMPLLTTNVQYLDHNATSMLPSTVQTHVELTYNPGDRLAAQTADRRRQAHRRQTPRPGGYLCTVDDCGKAFDRACDLNRHQKKHLDSSERPHKCNVCREGFLYPKDLYRHERKHDQQAILFCRIPGCNKIDGFTRRDNLLRHQRKQHPTPVHYPVLGTLSNFHS